MAIKKELAKLRPQIAELLRTFYAAIEMPVEEHTGEEGALLAPFGYGMVQAMTQEQGLTSADMYTLAVGFLTDVLKYDDEQAEEVADILTHAAGDPNVHPYHAIIQHGVAGYEQWMREDEDALVETFEAINRLLDESPPRSDERLKELVGKKQSGQATPAEEKELLNTLYMGTLPQPEDDGEPRFISKHRMQATDVVARVKAIDWFARCGEPCELDLTMEVEWVKSWSQAMKAQKSRAWDDAMAEARSQLTMFLAIHHRERYNNDWSKLTDKFKSKVVMPLTKKVWEPFQVKNKLSYAIVADTMWCILAALMENAYLDCNHNSFFFLELLTVYEAGHLPCGWRGRWPEGKLVVF